MTSDLSLPLPP
ncbi:hypothetical protein E2C01_090116 [Portunus trituberculatus]|uniref:Uncharacterized protein n=1 Tax=Portunus trituberculatus TaxID=210409 RepID=A0A5B7JK21_PORTR|nr:hypothetical protein [Portunus trituberculatus]